MKSAKTRKAPAIRHRDSLMTYHDDGRERCFGYLLECPGHGIFEPTFGKLKVSSREAKTHNELLSQGEIAGLDQNCAIGMRGTFYIRKPNGQSIVTTWLGEEVSRDVQVRGRVIMFNRNGMTFRSRLPQEEDWFHFKRIR